MVIRFPSVTRCPLKCDTLPKPLQHPRSGVVANCPLWPLAHLSQISVPVRSFLPVRGGFLLPVGVAVNPGVDGLVFAGPVLAMVWLALFTNVDVPRVYLLVVGTVIILSCNIFLNTGKRTTARLRTEEKRGTYKKNS